MVASWLREYLCEGLALLDHDRRRESGWGGPRQASEIGEGCVEIDQLDELIEALPCVRACVRACVLACGGGGLGTQCSVQRRQRRDDEIM